MDVTFALTPTLLVAAMKGCTNLRADAWAGHLQRAMDLFEINAPKRAADFIAQIGHESAGLLYDRELWGPTSEQRTYERDPLQPWGPQLKRGERNYKAYTLGNSEPGDGRRFSGHGPIQITGRNNHREVRDDLRELMGVEQVPDFEKEPLTLCLPKWGALAAGNFWRSRGLNAFSDRDDFEGQTRRINGGLNGLADRLERRERARRALGV